MPLSKEDALYGAAYKVMFERCDPDSCATPDQLATVQFSVDRVLVWASTQLAEVAAAYLRAAPEIVKRASDRVENNLRAIQMTAVLSQLPQPPKD